jgi:hypothetical protein
MAPAVDLGARGRLGFCFGLGSEREPTGGGCDGDGEAESYVGGERLRMGSGCGLSAVVPAFRGTLRREAKA